MADNIEGQLNGIPNRKSRVTLLDTLMQGYRLYARSEGMLRDMGMDYRLRRTQEVLESVEG